MRNPVDTGYRKCLTGCGKTITKRFAICANCEEIFGHAAGDWPDWLRILWNYTQREERQYVRVKKNEISVEMRDTDAVLSDASMEEEVLDRVCIEKFVDTLKPHEKIVLVLFSSGFKLVDIADITGVSRNTVPAILKRAQTLAYIQGFHDTGIP